VLPLKIKIHYAVNHRRNKLEFLFSLKKKVYLPTGCSYSLGG